MSFTELLHWVAFYTHEADLQMPPERRPVRPKSKEEAAKALDSIFGISTSKPMKG
jgi:hypothetical protein